MAAWLLNDADREVIKELIRQARVDGQTPTLRSQIDENTQTAPEVYIAFTPSGGIPARVGVIPGSADCTVYRLQIDTTGNSYSLADTGNTKTVYNLNTLVTGSSWVIVGREKFGSWFVIASTIASSGATVTVEDNHGNTVSGVDTLFFAYNTVSSGGGTLGLIVPDDASRTVPGIINVPGATNSQWLGNGHKGVDDLTTTAIKMLPSGAIGSFSTGNAVAGINPVGTAANSGVTFGVSFTLATGGSSGGNAKLLQDRDDGYGDLVLKLQGVAKQSLAVWNGASYSYGSNSPLLGGARVSGGVVLDGVTIQQLSSTSGTHSITSDSTYEDTGLSITFSETGDYWIMCPVRGTISVTGDQATIWTKFRNVTGGFDLAGTPLPVYQSEVLGVSDFGWFTYAFFYTATAGDTINLYSQSVKSSVLTTYTTRDLFTTGITAIRIA